MATFNQNGELSRVSKKHNRAQRPNIPSDEMHLLRQPGNARRDIAIFQARDEIAKRYPAKFADGDAVREAIVSGECPETIMAEFHSLREAFNA